MEFNNFYNSIKNDLRRYEFIRIVALLFVIAVECGLLWFLIWIFGEGFVTIQRASSVKVILLTVMFGGFVHWLVKKQLEIKIKENIIEIFTDCFADYEWEGWTLNDSMISEECLKSIKILPEFNASVSDDNFSGEYKGIPIIISEQKLINGLGIYSSKVFEGIVIEYSFGRNIFNSEIIVRDSGFLPPKDLQKVTLEDPEFDKMFDVYSNDQIESRYVLTTSFMERLKLLKNIFNAKHISVAFRYSQLYIAADIGHDCFNIAKLTKSIDDREDLKLMYNQFDFILKIADVLRLVQR